MTAEQDFLSAESAWKQSQDTPHDFLDSGADERARLHAEYLAAAFAWINEPSHAAIPTPDTQLDAQPVPSRLSGIVAHWNRDCGMGTIAASDGTCITFWKSGLTQSYTPGIGDNVTYRLGVSASRGEVSECAVGVTCTDMPAPVKTPAQLKAQTEDRKRRDLVQALAARREARQQKRMES